MCQKRVKSITNEQYEVCQCGAVYNRNGLELAQHLGGEKGYEYYYFYPTKNGKRKTVRVHREIYQSFYGKLPKGIDVHHIDNIKTNNKLDNLQPLSKSDNCFLRRARKDQSEFGKNITQRDNGKFRLNIIKNNKVVINKQFDSLKEAIKERDRFTNVLLKDIGKE